MSNAYLVNISDVLYGGSNPQPYAQEATPLPTKLQQRISSLALINSTILRNQRVAHSKGTRT